MGQPTARFEQTVGAFDVDPHAEIELGLGLSAQHGREMADDRDVVVHDGVGEVAVGDRANPGFDAGVGNWARHQIRRDHVGEPGDAAGIGQQRL